MTRPESGACRVGQSPWTAAGALAGQGIWFDLRDQPDQGSGADVGVRPTSFVADVWARTLLALKGGLGKAFGTWRRGISDKMKGPYPNPMALFFLLAVLLFVVLAIAFFVFPPSTWVKMMQGDKKDKQK